MCMSVLCWTLHKYNEMLYTKTSENWKLLYLTIKEYNVHIFEIS